MVARRGLDRRWHSHAEPLGEQPQVVAVGGAQRVAEVMVDLQLGGQTAHLPAPDHAHTAQPLGRVGAQAPPTSSCQPLPCPSKTTGCRSTIRFTLHQALTAGARSAVIVGGGYIGLEMAEAFTARGLAVTLVEQAPAVMPTVDVELGRLLGQELGRHRVQVVTDVTGKAIGRERGRLVVAGEPDFTCAADLVLVVVGVRPDTDLAVAAGIETGMRGAIRVDRRMRTSLPDVLAAGDCIETYHRLLERPAHLPLGTTAHKQGRVAGETAVGGTPEFAGSLGTQVVKVFDLGVARTGLRNQDAVGFDPVTVGSVQFDHKAYYPGAHQLHLRITGDRVTGRLLGAQLVGDHDAEVAKRIDIPGRRPVPRHDRRGPQRP